MTPNRLALSIFSFDLYFIEFSSVFSYATNREVLIITKSIYWAFPFLAKSSKREIWNIFEEKKVRRTLTTRMQRTKVKVLKETGYTDLSLFLK